MKTSEIIVNTQGVGMDEALAATEKLGQDSGLSHKENLRLRLLAEELIGLMRGITGSVEARYQAGQEEREFTLSLSANVVLDQEMRRQLIAASSSGKNAAAKGLMGRIREMVAIVLLPRSQEPAALTNLSLGLISMGSPMGYAAGEDAYTWSMSTYMSELQNSMNEAEDAKEAYDELEKSIVANLADEVSVSIVGARVEITITKAF
jgi:hypothetical protein